MHQPSRPVPAHRGPPRAVLRWPPAAPPSWIAALALTALGAVGARAVGGSLDLINALRRTECRAVSGPLPPLRLDQRLTRAAHAWATGTAVDLALRAVSYRFEGLKSIHLEGSGTPLRAALAARGCRLYGDPTLRDIGVYERGSEHWLLLAREYRPPGAGERDAARREVRHLSNVARRHGQRCGATDYGPSMPLHASDALDRAAQAYAEEIARSGRFEHQDSAGRSPADRARAAGYRPRLVGENLAAGPSSAADAVAGWLASAGHCANLLDPRFSESGVGLADPGDGHGGAYWVELFGAPSLPAR